MFAVAAKAEQRGDDQLRAAAGAGAGHGLADNFQARGQIRAVHRLRFDAVTNGLVGEVAAGKLARGRRGIGVLIVGHDQNQRQFFHGGLVERLVKRAGGSGAVADAGRARPCP